LVSGIGRGLTHDFVVHAPSTRIPIVIRVGLEGSKGIFGEHELQADDHGGPRERADEEKKADKDEHLR